MKICKIVFTGIILLTACTVVRAQTEKGKFLLGGGSTLSFNTSNAKWEGDDESYKSSNIDFAPRFGYFIADNLAVGLELPVWHYWSDNDKSTSIYCGPFLKYYFGQNRFRPYLSGATEFGKDKSEYTYSDGDVSESTVRSFRYSVGGGLGLFISEHTAIDLGIVYIHEDSRDKYEDEPTMKGQQKGLDIEVGFVFLF